MYYIYTYSNLYICIISKQNWYKSLKIKTWDGPKCSYLYCIDIVHYSIRGKRVKRVLIFANTYCQKNRHKRAILSQCIIRLCAKSYKHFIYKLLVRLCTLYQMYPSTIGVISCNQKYSQNVICVSLSLDGFYVHSRILSGIAVC